MKTLEEYEADLKEKEERMPRDMAGIEREKQKEHPDYMIISVCERFIESRKLEMNRLRAIIEAMKKRKS